MQRACSLSTACTSPPTRRGARQEAETELCRGLDAPAGVLVLCNRALVRYTGTDNVQDVLLPAALRTKTRCCRRQSTERIMQLMSIREHLC